MKSFIVTILILSQILWACNSTDAPDCLKSSGSTTTEAVALDPFSAIEVNQEFNIVIEEAAEQQVTISAGENIIAEIQFEVIDKKLIISNNISCVWARSYDFPSIVIKHPNLWEIRQNGGGTVESADTLNYPTLTLISENSTGDFELSLNSQSLEIVNNEVSNYYLSGTVDQLTVGFYAGDSRFEGANLKAKNATVFHRGTNDVIVNVSDKLTGRLLATGDLIYVDNTPTTIDVSLENRGHLIDKTD